MLAFIRQLTIVISLILTGPMFGWTQSYTSTAEIYPSYSSTLLVNTLLLGCGITWLNPERLDPELFQDYSPEVLDLTENLTLKLDWPEFLKRMLEKTEPNEKQIIKELQSYQAELNYQEHEQYDFDLDPALIPSRNISADIVITPIPGILSYTGSDTRQDDDKKDAKSETKDSEGEKKEGKDDKQSEDLSTSQQTQSTACAKPVPETIGPLTVIKEEDRPILERSLELYRQNQCRKIGRGSYSRVYKLTESGQMIIIKIPSLPSAKRLNNEQIIKDETHRTLAQAENEKEILMKLQHKNIVTMRAYAEIHLPELGRTWLLVLEFAGKTLEHYLDKEHYEQIRSHVLTIARSVLDALIFVHDQGMVLADMNSENILIRIQDDTLQVQLIDLATCQTLEQRQRMGIDDIGSPGWMAPECLRDCKVVPHSFTQNSDRFGIGIMAALLAGIHRQSCFRNEFRHKRVRESHLVNEVLLDWVTYDDGKYCMLSRQQLATAGIPPDEAIKTIATDRGFLKLIAILSTRPAPSDRANDHQLIHYFSTYEKK